MYCYSRHVKFFFVEERNNNGCHDELLSIRRKKERKKMCFLYTYGRRRKPEITTIKNNPCIHVGGKVETIKK
jgi:hypothetical protein